MGKLVVLKLGDGTVEQGFSVTLQIGEETARPSTEVMGRLPAAPDILQHFQQWQATYRQLGMHSRLSAVSQQITNVSMVEECDRAAQVLRHSLNSWLNSEPFRSIKEKLLEKLSPTHEIRVLLQTRDIQLQRLPWHVWDFFDRYPKAEIALSAPAYEVAGQAKAASDRVKILAILGNSDGINVQVDRQLLEQLSGAEVNFLVQPQRRQLADQFWRKSWDLLFFAGHSSTSADAETGWIEISPTERLTIPQLKFALKKAVERGLRFAIFNSCDGLGLAQNLADLRIPQIIVMREPIPDAIAQEFLKNFLEAFSQGVPFYLAVREARERLEALEDQFPCATWLPVIFQNPAEVPPAWKDLCHEMVFKPQSAIAPPTQLLTESNPVTEMMAYLHNDAVEESPFPLTPETIIFAHDPEPDSELNYPESAFTQVINLDTTEAATQISFEAPVSVEPAVAPVSVPSTASLFLDHCRRELTRCIGPIATMILQEVQTSQPSHRELIEMLAAKIPNLHQAEQFRQQMQEMLNAQSLPQEVGRSPATEVITYRSSSMTQPAALHSAPLDPAFLEQCRQKLAKSIGPIANHILKTTLSQHPAATPQQLVELLAANLPNAQQAEDFKRTLL